MKRDHNESFYSYKIRRLAAKDALKEQKAGNWLHISKPIAFLPMSEVDVTTMTIHSNEVVAGVAMATVSQTKGITYRNPNRGLKA